MNKTYLFYDIETTGLNKCFDQVLQFAAIRTDMQLNELERYNFLVRLNPDIIPSPTAVITHHISLDNIKNGDCEYDATAKIHQLLNHPGTISLGYNTLGFDDEFLRFSFYRNLFTPYTHQYANGCSRMDIYPMVAMFFLFKHEVITWPECDGKSTLKLEHISEANRLADGAAHDAMVDVVATVELAKRLQKHGDMWRYLCGYFTKDIDLARMAKIDVGIMVDGIFGADNYYHAPVLSLGAHKHYKNQMLWLRLDREELQQASVDDVESAFVLRKKIGENYFILPWSLNYLQHLSPERAKLVEGNRAWLNTNPQILRAISTYYREYKYPVVPNVDVDAALYQVGFPSSADEALCRQFHQIDVNKKAQFIERFGNPRMHQQAIRIIGRNFIKKLSREHLLEFEEYLTSVLTAKPDSALVDYKNGRKFTRQDALREIDELRTGKLTDKQRELLDELRDYLQLNS